jgi:putative ABC transport system permease protein
VFAGGVGVAVFALWLAALGLVRAVRRFFPRRWPYVWRQGLANLFRPANQTVTVVLALGFGAFLLATLFLVQHNLLRELRAGGTGPKPNLVLFDIQADQRGPVEARLREAGLRPTTPVPIVPMRISSVKGVPVTQVIAAEPDEGTPRSRRWAFRREYRSTYRDALVASERVVEGDSWPPPGWAHGTEPVPVSVEEEVAAELGVGVGDEIVWDVQGVPVRTRVSSLREVQWARFEPNFFVVFPEGPLRDAPQTYVTLARADDPAVRERIQRRLVEAFPNVSAVDLSQVQVAIEDILSRVSLAVRFMAVLSLGTGAVILVGAVATTRYQRAREAVLLKTLGARRGQILRIALAEYLCLGTLSVTTALLLASLAGWGLVRHVFEERFGIPGLSLAGLGAAVIVLTVAVGLWNSRDVLRRPPLEVLRAE